MEYNHIVILKNKARLQLRNGTYSDGKAVSEVFNQTHAQTDYLLSYPDENSFDSEQEAQFLQKKTESENAIEILAFWDGKLVGTAGIEPIGNKYKVKHRADFGIAILKEYWNLGIGRALTNACIECARTAGYKQLELEVVAGNEKAICLYESVGFQEYGRNPKGFLSRNSGCYQELILMRLE